MSDKYKLALELLKYPILIISIFVALWAAKHILGLRIDRITDLGPSGIKIQIDTNTAIIALESKLDGLSSKVNSLENYVKVPDKEKKEIQTLAFEQSQTVSDKTATLSVSTEQLTKLTQNLKGYMWIGNYDNNWDVVKLAYPDTGQPITIPPSEIIGNTEYKVLGNMVVRNGLPDNNEQYFEGKQSLGVIPKGSRIRVIQKPTEIKRPRANQYWAEIEIVELAPRKN